MRLQNSRSFARLTAILAAACFMATPADARVCRDGVQCSATGAHKKKLARQARHVRPHARMQRAERRRFARVERADLPWHGWGTSFHLDGVRYPGGNPRGPAAWYNNWEGGFHPVAFWVLHDRNRH